SIYQKAPNGLVCYSNYIYSGRIKNDEEPALRPHAHSMLLGLNHAPGYVTAFYIHSKLTLRFKSFQKIFNIQLHLSPPSTPQAKPDKHVIDSIVKRKVNVQFVDKLKGFCKGI
uniref:Uncharacterized protein n=1 Tax=Scleropages formosus TaxID=113540 RepID=A0A8C9R7X3_SCLFO